MFVKFEILYCLASLGLNVLYTDSDIVFLCNIVERMGKMIRQHQGADFIMQNDTSIDDSV
jgi:hypothetical protein